METGSGSKLFTKARINMYLFIYFVVERLCPIRKERVGKGAVHAKTRLYSFYYKRFKVSYKQN